MAQSKPVVVVTGGSRGAGRGIAVALGSYGCTVYVTGRTSQAGEHALPGTIYETAEAVTKAGGKGIAVRVDHANNDEVKALFEQVKAEQGRVDIVVNNAAALHDQLTAPGNFWEKPLELSNLLDVGVRSSFVSSWYAAHMMVEQKHGLLIFTGASGGVHYVFGPVYGVHKGALDKFAHDMAIDLKPFDVAAISIWMGGLKTDRLQMVIDSDPEKFKHLEETLETPEFTGHIIWGIYNDPELMEMSGQAVMGAEIAHKYGIKDVGGKQPPSYFEMHGIRPVPQYEKIVR